MSLQRGELPPDSVIRKFRITATDGKAYETQHYNLEVVIAVGYRVKSQRGTQFRQWATARLKEYLVKGFTMDDERLKNPPGKGQQDYFDELLERIREIRASERRFLPIPTGLRLQAQGREARATLGLVSEHFPQPQRGCDPTSRNGHNLVEVETSLRRFPKVARSGLDRPTSQPWAEGHCPVGANKGFSTWCDWCAAHSRAPAGLQSEAVSRCALTLRYPFNFVRGGTRGLLGCAGMKICGNLFRSALF